MRPIFDVKSRHTFKIAGISGQKSGSIYQADCSDFQIRGRNAVSRLLKGAKYFDGGIPQRKDFPSAKEADKIDQFGVYSILAGRSSELKK
jgi:hypothetical protein